jgi:probable HAF family extracellular repeat protein
VGYSTTTDWNNRYRAFLWTAKDGMINLGSLGGSQSFADGINDRGQVVGSSSIPGGHGRAFLWTAKDGMTDLGIIAGSQGAYAEGINERGDVVGSSYWASGESRATLWPAH